MTITQISDREIALQAQLAAMTASRDEYQQAADKMAMEHKVERDTLRQQLAEAQRDAERYRHLFKGNKVYSSFMRAYGEWDGCGGKAGFDNSMDAAMKGAA